MTRHEAAASAQRDRIAAAGKCRAVTVTQLEYTATLAEIRRLQATMADEIERMLERIGA